MTAPFTRCPTCGCIDWPPSWPAIHARTCHQSDTDPRTWNTEGETHE